MRTVTSCTLDCPDACSLVVETDEQGNVRIEGNPDHPFTAGFTCAKMRRFADRLRQPDRITTPLLKQDGGWRAIGWDQALSLCAERIQGYRSEPASIVQIRGGGDQGAMTRFGDLFWTKLGARGTIGTLCNAAGKAGFVEDFGAALQNDVPELLNSVAIVNWGRDMSRSSVHMGRTVVDARKRGTQVWTISPGGDGNRAFSDHLIVINPGTDRFLAAAIARLLIEHRAIRPDLLERTHGWEEFRHTVMSRTVEGWSAACGVAIQDIERLGEVYAAAGPTATIVGWGLQRYDWGGETVRFINALAMLSGNVGRSGGGSYYTLSPSASFNYDWARTPGDRPGLVRPVIGQAILDAKSPPVRMLWVTGTNIVNQAADSHTVARAFTAVQFKVVVDAFMNDTSERADLILPPTLTLEREDLIGGCFHPYVNYARAAVQAPGECRDDAWIVNELGKRLDPPIEMPDFEECLAQTLRSPVLDVSLEELRRTGFVRSNRPPVPFVDLQFPTQTGKYHLPQILHAEDPAPVGYPYRLLSLLRRDAIHSQLAPDQQTGLPAVWVAPGSPVMSGIDDSRPLFLATRLGRLRVRLELQPGLHPRAILYRRGDWMKLGGGVNQLIEADVSDVGYCAPFYKQYARLEN